MRRILPRTLSALTRTTLLTVLLIAPLAVPLTASAPGGDMRAFAGSGPRFAQASVPASNAPVALQVLIPWGPAPPTANIAALGFSTVSFTLDAAHVVDLATTVQLVSVCPGLSLAAEPALGLACAPLTHGSAAECATIATLPVEKYCVVAEPTGLAGLASVPPLTLAIELGNRVNELSLRVDLQLAGVPLPGRSPDVVVRAHNEQWHLGFSAGDAIASTLFYEITAGPVVSFTFGNLALSSTANTDHPSFTLSARDAVGNVKADYEGNVTFASTDPKATTPLLASFRRADAGVLAFPAGSVRFRTSGAQTITACDQLASACGTSSSVQVAAGPLARLAIEHVGGIPQDQLVLVNGQVASLRLAGFDSLENRIAPDPVGTWSVARASGEACGALADPAAASSAKAFTASRPPNATRAGLPGTPVACRIQASSGGVDATTLPVTVLPGAFSAIDIVNAPAGEGASVGPFTLTADEHKALFVAAYDAQGAYLGDVTAAWSVVGGCGTLTPSGSGPGVVFDAVRVSSPSDGCVVSATTSAQDPRTPSARTDTTGAITVTPGIPVRIGLFDLATGGPAIGTLLVATEARIPVYAGTQDADANFVAPIEVTWALVDTALPACATIAPGPLAAPVPTIDPGAPAAPSIGPENVTSARSIFLTASSIGTVLTNACRLLAVAMPKDANGPLFPPAQAQVSIVSPDNIVLTTGDLSRTVGDRAPIAYQAVVRERTRVLRANISWSIDPPEGGSFAPETSTLTPGTTAGAFSIRAAFKPRALQATSTLTILAGPLASFALTCAPQAPWVVGTEVACSAADGRDAAGFSTTLGPVTWSVTNKGGVSIPHVAGVFTAPLQASEGPLTITATSGTVVEDLNGELAAAALAAFSLACDPASATVGDTIACSVSGGVDVHGNSRDVGSVEYTITNVTGATLDQDDGTFTAPTSVTEGPLSVRAIASSVATDVVVSLSAGALDTFLVTCGPERPVVGETVTCAASGGADRYGNPQSIGTVSWSVADAAGDPIDVSSAGRFSAPLQTSRAPLRVEALATTVTSSLELALAAAALDAFDISCAPTPAPLGADVACEASGGRDAHGNPVPLGEIGWSAANASGAAVPIDAGDLQAPTRLDAGPLVIRATSAGITAITELPLATGPLVTFKIDCGALQVVASETISCEAIDGEDAYGHSRVIGPVWWTAENAQGGAVPIDEGVLHAPTRVDAGPLRVRAAAAGGEVVEEITIEIIPGPLVTFELVCDAEAVVASVVACATQNGEDEHGNAAAIGTVTWSVTDATGAALAVSDEGAFTAPSDRARGPVRVSVSANAIVVEIVLPLVAGPLSAFELRCSATEVVAGEAVVCSVSNGTDAHGHARAIGDVAWTAFDVGGNAVAITNGDLTTPSQVAAGPIKVRARAAGIQVEASIALAPPPQPAAAPPPPPPPPPPPAPPATPIARFEAPSRVDAGTSLRLEAAFDPFYPDASYEWDLGDGNRASGRVVEHAWTTPGDRVVRLVVSANGVAGSALRLISVLAPPPPPPSSPPTPAPPVATPAISNATEDPPAALEEGSEIAVPEVIVLFGPSPMASPALIGFEVDEGVVVYWRAGAAPDWDTTQPAIVAGDGPVTFEYYAVGPGGRSPTRTATLMLDGAAPVVGPVRVPRGAIAGASLAISVEVSDVSAITAVATLVRRGDDNVTHLALASEDGVFRALVTLEPGEYAVGIFATDAFGRATRLQLPDPLVVAREVALDESSVRAAASEVPGPGVLVMIVAALSALGWRGLRRRLP